MGLMAERFRPGQLLRHKYGGLYRVIGQRQAEDGGWLLCYAHVWPFELCEFARPLAECAERFTPVSETVLQEEEKGDRDAARERIRQAKATAASASP